MQYTFKSLETLAISEKSFPRRQHSHRRLRSPRRCLWLEISKKLLRIYGENLFKKVLFMDEKIFTIKQKFSKQNNKMYVRTLYKAEAKLSKIQRGLHPSSMMVWWGVSWNGTTVIHFCTSGVKTTAKIDEETILKPVEKPLNDTLFKGQLWIFQQDSAPAHKSKC